MDSDFFFSGLLDIVSQNTVQRGIAGQRHFLKFLAEGLVLFQIPVELFVLPFPVQGADNIEMMADIVAGPAGFGDAGADLAVFLIESSQLILQLTILG